MSCFRTYCTNVGCKKEMEPVLDKTDNKIYCTACSKEITGVTDFMKRQLETLGQIRKDEKPQQAFSVKCNACQKSNPPKLKDGELFCSNCDVAMKNLAPQFVLAIKEFLGEKKEIKKETKKVSTKKK